MMHINKEPLMPDLALRKKSKMKSETDTSAIKVNKWRSSYSPQSMAIIRMDELKKRRLKKYDNVIPASEKTIFLAMIIIL